MRGWCPDWCTHVEGAPIEAIDETGDDDPIRVDMRCLVCKAVWRSYCWTGQWTRRVEVFAILHQNCWGDMVQILTSPTEKTY